MIDESQIEYLLNGERAEADVLNRPLKQLVSATNASLSEVNDAISDAISDSADGAALLIEERYNDIFEVTRDGNGFTREKDARLIFNASNATVSIAPSLGKSTWFYYHKGRKIESSETLTYTLSAADKANGGFYLSFDKDGNFVNTGPHPDFYNTTLCFYVHYSNGEFIIEGDERHAADRDTAWHHSHHREDGMVIYTLGNIDWTPNDANKVGIQITSTLVADEDLQHLIKHSPTGVEPFSQILEGSQDTVRIPTLYYDGNIRYLANKKLPWVVGALKYNDGTTLKDVPNGKFVNYFLAATHCQKYPIKLIMGRKIFDSDDETVDETLESLGLNFPEMALLYRISLERNNSLSTVGKCTLKSVQQAASRITFESAAGSAGSGLSNHAQLLGRTEDNAHPMSAITGLQEAFSNANSTTTDALATKVDKSTKVIAGTGLTGGGDLSANRTLTVKYGTAAGTAAQGNDSRIVNAASNATVNAKEAALEAKKADKEITITAGTGLSGGGTLAANRSFSVNYGTASGTAAQGNDSRITGALQSSQVVQTTGTSTTSVMSQKAVTDAITHTGSSLTVSYGTTAGTAAEGNDSRIVNAASNDTVNAKEAALEAKKADKEITITAGTGLSGGGDLSANRTLSVKYGTALGTAAQGNDSRITGALQSSQVVQTTGTSTTNIMSQKAVTDAITHTGSSLAVSYGTTAGTAAEGNDSRIVNAASNDTVNAKEAALEAKKADKAITITAGTGLSGGGTLAANRTLAVSYGTTAGTAAQGNDSRLSDSREWTAGTISQAEAEVGTATTRRAFTAQRVRQAIVAWWNSITSAFGRDLVTSASDSVARSKLGLHTSALRWPTWTEVTSKPTTFTPSSHTHPWDQVTGQPATATRWPTFAEVTGLTDAIANIPSVPKSTSYTVTVADKGKSIDTSANVTIPPDVFSVGDTLVVTNTTAGEIRIIPGTGVTIRHAGTEDSGTAILGSYGVTTLRMVTNNNWHAIGMGMSI